jgi:protein phosphatase
VRTRQTVTTNPRIGGFYAAVAAVLAGLAGLFRPWGLLLLWPAASVAIVAGAYFGLYAGIARKRSGRLSVAGRAVLAPWLLGQQLSLMYYRRRAAPYDAVVSNVWIGRQLNRREAVLASKRGVVAVVDFTGEFSEAGPLLSLTYLNLQVLDLTAPTPDQIHTAVDFINAHRSRGAVFVHCKIGYSRSATVVGCWLLDAGLAATAEDAVARIRAARPSLVLRPEGWAALREFAASSAPVNVVTTSRLIEVRT